MIWMLPIQERSELLWCVMLAQTPLLSHKEAKVGPRLCVILMGIASKVSRGGATGWAGWAFAHTDFQM